ncbi:MAG: helix-turn-helix domain-containing protein [Pseudomonadota bacterium]
MSIVTSKLKISEKEVFSRIKLQKVVRGRHLIWWILHRRFGWSLGRIGLAADRDHTSILHGVRAIDHFAERPGAADWLADLVGEIHLAIEARK